MFKPILAASVAALCIAAPAGATSLNDVYSSLFFLGDSLTDDGNLGVAGPPPPYYQNQFSDGPTYADRLDDGFADGTTQNYAYGGARTETTGFVPSLGGDVPDLPDQLDFFAADLLGLDYVDPGTGPIELFPGTPTVGDDPLVTIWAGANDMLATVGEFGAAIAAIDPTLSDAQKAQAYGAALGMAFNSAAEAAARVIDAVEVIATSAPFSSFGFDTFLVLNLPDLGATPLLNDTPIAAEAREITKVFNLALANEIALFSAPADILSFDVFQLFDDVLAGEVVPGLTNLTDSCVAQFGSADDPCNPSAFLFWDDVHPTGVVHAALARELNAALVPLPPALAMSMAGLALLGLFGTRSASRKA